MAKKKKSKAKRRPANQRRSPAPRPSAPAAEAPAPAERRAGATTRRQAEQKRRRRRLRSQLRIGLILLVVAAAIGTLIVTSVLSSRRNAASFDKLTAGAGCTAVRTTQTSGSQQHLEAGKTTTYDSAPPTHGPHDPSPLTAGVYTEPFSSEPSGSPSNTIFRAVHSLEHGYVIAWYTGLSPAQVTALAAYVDKQKKVILVPYPDLKSGTLALTAWGRLMTCRTAEPAVVNVFVKRFREKTAPENAAP